MHSIKYSHACKFSDVSLALKVLLCVGSSELTRFALQQTKPYRFWGGKDANCTKRSNIFPTFRKRHDHCAAKPKPQAKTILPEIQRIEHVDREPRSARPAANVQCGPTMKKHSAVTCTQTKGSSLENLNCPFCPDPARHDTSSVSRNPRDHDHEDRSIS